MSVLKKMRPLVFIAFTGLIACNSAPHTESSSTKNLEASETKTPSSEVETRKISEALGHFIGRNLNAPGIHFDLESIILGIREGASGKPAPMNDAEYEKAMTQLQEKAVNALAETNLQAANQFMKENAHAKGVVEIIPEKLQYIILEDGQGPVVPEHGTPQINYTGKYLNGTVFGSSENAGGPITVPIDQTIPGFSKGIAGMKEGEKRRLFLHPEFGYGRTGQLPPNSLLVFDIEVIKAVSPEKDSTDAHADEERDLDDDLENEMDQEFDERSATDQKHVK